MPPWLLVVAIPVLAQLVAGAAYIAVTSSKASSGLPPVFTFSKTTQTASLEVDLSRAMTGTR